ncbi:MAG TPA: nuclear transport factor 2 family protein [Vicinamibacterales bacterium]|nr:nuclear transport factor 2 family protein [Vicinamibacterales bacterium]
MTNVLSRRRLTASGLALIVALGALQVVSAGDQSPATSAAARVQRLALNVERAESVRAVKRLQETYAQYSQFGLWTEMAALFADNAQLSYGNGNEQGRQAIQSYFLNTFGEGTHGLKTGGLHTQMVLRPLINVSADGQRAKGRWWEFSMTGQYGVKAEWAGGIFENEYVREGGVWKIARMRYNPMFAGPYATGWRNVDEDQKIVPYHFTPDEAGIPLPELSASAVPPVDPKMDPATALAALEQRILAMNDEDKVRNLQNAYGYYMDRKMWDDVTDLFTADGALAIANVGVYDGPGSIRRALERSGPAGLKNGQLNELMQLDMAVAIEPGGLEARGRGLEFGLVGDAEKGTAFYTLAIFENRYVKQNDIWRIREMRIFPLMKTEKTQGWARSQVVDPPPAREHAPDRPMPASDVMTPGAVPVFFAPNPATGKPVSLPAGMKTVGQERLLKAPQVTRPAAPSGDLNARITEAERKLAVSKAWDGAENMSSAYGDYLDDLDYGQLGKLFAVKGNKEVPFSGFYVGRQRIIERDATSPPPGSRPRTTLPLHWRTQPVILVASDGRSASVRSRLLQPGSSRTRSSGIGGGMYHDQVVLEDGIWRLWSVTIDEHYYSSAYEGGWSPAGATTAPRGRGAAPAAGVGQGPAPGRGQANAYPPDIPLTVLGERERGFRGGTGETITWPGILPMWFHYKNPVSGRQPEHYWPDCVPCIQFPETSMKNHGYLLPPS